MVSALAIFVAGSVASSHNISCTGVVGVDHAYGKFCSKKQYNDMVVIMYILHLRMLAW